MLGGTLETQDYSDLKDGSILYLGYLLEGERVTLTNGDDEDETQKVSAEANSLPRKSNRQQALRAVLQFSVTFREAAAPQFRTE